MSISVLDSSNDKNIEARLEEYLAGIGRAAENYNCDVDGKVFSTELGLFYTRLREGLKTPDVQSVDTVLREMRTYLNDHLYGICNFGDRRDISFYDNNWVGKREIHVQQDGLKDLIVSEFFGEKRIGADNAAKAQALLYPETEKSSCLSILALAGVIAASFALGRCSKADNHSSRIERERNSPAAVQQAGR